MGCNQSTVDVERSSSIQKLNAEKKNSMDENSNSKVIHDHHKNGGMKTNGHHMNGHTNGVISNKHSSKHEEECLERFRAHLMAQLQAVAASGGPPMMPQPLVEGDPRLVMVPAIFTVKQTLAELQHTPLPSSSALIVTYLKSGTHWAWEIVKMLKKGEATTDNIPKEMAHIEFSPPSALKAMNDGDSSAYVTHIPIWALPKSSYSQTKTVYVYRNPKDVCVSLYYHFMNMSNANPEGFPPLPFDHFFEMFMGPSETNIMGNWFDHVADYWDNHRTDSNILCVTYEDMKKNPLKEVTRIAQHIGAQDNDDLLQQVVKATSFSSMKKGKEASETHLEIVFKGTMYRKGDVGDWKNHLSEDQSRRIDERVEAWQKERAEQVPLIFEL